MLNTRRQLGGALAVAVFGALLADPATFDRGMRDPYRARVLVLDPLVG